MRKLRSALAVTVGGGIVSLASPVLVPPDSYIWLWGVNFFPSNASGSGVAAVTAIPSDIVGATDLTHLRFPTTIIDFTGTGASVAKAAAQKIILFQEPILFVNALNFLGVSTYGTAADVLTLQIEAIYQLFDTSAGNESQLVLPAGY